MLLVPLYLYHYHTESPIQRLFLKGVSSVFGFSLSQSLLVRLIRAMQRIQKSQQPIVPLVVLFVVEVVEGRVDEQHAGQFVAAMVALGHQNGGTVPKHGG